jgi:hypothetical protein
MLDDGAEQKGDEKNIGVADKNKFLHYTIPNLAFIIFISSMNRTMVKSSPSATIF